MGLNAELVTLLINIHMTLKRAGFGWFLQSVVSAIICKKAVDPTGADVTWLSMKTKFMVYLRVSTNRQGESGLGLEAQRSAVTNFVRSMGSEAEIVREFIEIESAKGGVNRPVLAEAVRDCKANGCTLLVAKLDRLSRNLHFVTALQNAKVDFVAADNPHATPFLIHILVAVAEHERNMISSRTKAALDAARARGVKFGNPRYEEAIPKAINAWKKLAADRNEVLRRTVAEVMEKTGLTKLAEVAHALNLRGLKTNRGCEFTPTQVHRLLKAA